MDDSSVLKRRQGMISGLNRLRRNLVLLLGAGFLAALWHAATYAVHSAFFPGPLAVGAAFKELLLNGDVQGYKLHLHAWASLFRVLKGFAVGVVTGIPLGIAFGIWNKFYDYAKLLVEPVRFIPPLAWVPLAIIFLKGESRYIFLIWLGAFFPVLITTMAGVQAIGREYWEVGRVLNAGRLQMITKIALPAAAPHMAAGARLGLGTGWACIVAAEMIGGESVGLGRMIVSYGELLRVDVVMVGMICIGCLGYLLNEICLALERRLFPWRRETSL